MSEQNNEKEEPNQPPLPRPTIQSQRFLLRPFFPEDAEDMQRLVNDRDIARFTRSIDYPYPLENAKAWIASHEQLWNDGKAIVFAICEIATGALRGAVGLHVSQVDHHAEVGYWIGKELWGKGIATEACSRAIRYGFEELGLERIHAHHMAVNPASGKVLEKSGMTQEGYLRKHVRKWGEFHDIVFYGVLAEEWRNGQGTV
ncbi:MAG: GNAT family N-acetyltransferase [Pirellulaceae bacterium]